jgi:hypothetical protein
MTAALSIPVVAFAAEIRVGSTGFEPVTFAMSRRCHSH